MFTPLTVNWPEMEQFPVTLKPPWIDASNSSDNDSTCTVAHRKCMLRSWVNSRWRDGMLISWMLAKPVVMPDGKYTWPVTFEIDSPPTFP